MTDSIKKLYLFSYNLLMFLGFAYALTVMSSNFLANPDHFPAECWSTVGHLFKVRVDQLYRNEPNLNFKVLHVLMYLEVLNPLLGLTKGSVPTAMIQAKLSTNRLVYQSSFLFWSQVSGRNIFLWILIGNEERMQSQNFVFYLFMTYSSIEVFRCKFYIKGF